MSVDLIRAMGPVARHIFGEPDRVLKKGKEWRYGSRDGLKINLEVGTFHDFESGDKGGVLKLLKRELHLEGADAFELLKLIGVEVPDNPQPQAKQVSQKTEKEPDRDRSAFPLRIWSEAVRPQNTPAWLHLRKRGIDTDALPLRLGEALRWHPRCPWGESTTQGCMLGLYTDALTGEPKAIHRTAITPEGVKISRRYLGPTGGCVIRLWPDEEVTFGLVIGEGIETCLGAATRVQYRGTLLQPAWAAGDAGNLVKFPVLPGVEALTILVDHDDSEAGQRAALACSKRWTVVGREVVRLIPNAPGADFNDIARGAA